MLALLAGIWAAIDAQWWLVATCSIVGGAAYALGGRRWFKAYRAEPARHAREVSKPMVGLAVACPRRTRAPLHLPLMADLDPNVIAPARLKLLVTLTAVSEVEFSTVRILPRGQRLRPVQASCRPRRRQLREAAQRVCIVAGAPPWISLTPDGRAALGTHIEALQALIDGVTAAG